MDSKNERDKKVSCSICMETKPKAILKSFLKETDNKKFKSKRKTKKSNKKIY